MKRQSQRLQQLAAICCIFSLRLRGVTAILGAFGIPLCHMSVWHDVQDSASAFAHRLYAIVKKNAMLTDGRYIGYDA